MAYPKEIRDVIHGFVLRNEVEESIIDTKVFQRLRGVKQLAMANLVYPGALHTRFDHSIGVMHIAGRMAEQLGLNPEETRRIRLATLLHDVGHGPFSHVSEELLDKYYDKSKFKPKEKEEIHEVITCKIIESNNEIEKNLSNNDKEMVVDLISKDQHESIKKHIVTGPIDADKQDYLLRDSYYCGVKYGIYDIERLLSTMIPMESAQDRIISIKEGGIYAVEQFVLSKYHMSTQVYRHKIRLVTDAMIVRGLELGIEIDKLPFLIDLYKYDGSDEFIKNYLLWDDSRITNEILFNSKNDGYSKIFFLRLKERNLFKSVFHSALNKFNAIVKDGLSEIKEQPELKSRIQKKIAKHLSSTFKIPIDENLILIIVWDIKSVRAEKSKDNIGNMIVKFDSGETKRFDDCSTLFRSINAQERDQFIDIFAPVNFTTELIKRQVRAKLNQELFDIISEETKSFFDNESKEVSDESK